MGCDIHMYKEKSVGGKWLTADEWVPYDYGDGENGKEVPWEKRFTDRNYELFGVLSSGVRREHTFSLKPRGMPFNPSEEVKEANKDWDSDGHSHSYLYLFELRELRAFLASATIKVSGMKDADQLKALQDSIASGTPKWDLIFPYCQSTNAPGAVDFEIDIPADFYMGESLDKIITGFDGIEGDNHRVVFWFDN